MHGGYCRCLGLLEKLSGGLVAWMLAVDDVYSMAFGRPGAINNQLRTGTDKGNLTV